MNYEQKYKEALERATKIHSKERITGIELVTCEEIFPELKESEDERIRKGLIKLFKHTSSNDVIFSKEYGYTKEEVLAWLEKQGEQKPEFCHHEVDLSNCSEEYRKAYYDGWNNCNQQHSQLEAEQKPAWSEEDEEMFDAIIADIQFTQKAHTHEVNQVVYEREIDWIKSLKERMKGNKV